MTISHDVQDNYFTSILLGKQKIHTKPNDHVKLHSEKVFSHPTLVSQQTVLGFHSKTILQAVSHLHSLLSVLSGGIALSSPKHQNSCLKYISGTGRYAFVFYSCFYSSKMAFDNIILSQLYLVVSLRGKRSYVLTALWIDRTKSNRQSPLHTPSSVYTALVIL